MVPMAERRKPKTGGSAGPDLERALACEIALENMRDAVALYDQDERLVLANRLYRRMYGLPAALARPGAHFAEIIAHAKQKGLLSDESASSSRMCRDLTRRTGEPLVFLLETAGGRIYEVHERPLPGGGWVSTHADVTERQRAEERIAVLASRDPLTHLLNLFAFQVELERRLAEGGRLALVRIDVVGFRLINEAYGQAGGDAILSMIARRGERVREDFVFGRVGGDEYAAIAPADDPDALEAAVEELRRELCHSYRLGPVDLAVNVTVGYAIAPEHGTNVETLMRRADSARRRAAEAGGGQVGLFDWDIEKERELRMRLAHDILPGIDRQEFMLAFQPIVELATGRVTGAEALLRWVHPVLGPMAPDLVVSVAEEYGRIEELGEWVLRRAAASALGWPRDLGVSVNVSGLQIRSRGFTRMIRSVLKDTGLEPHRLMLEVTESTVLADRGAQALMERINGLGVRFALDDFGTGFASLHYLLKYPFGRIKIDRSFVAGMAGRADSRTIVEAMVGLGVRLGKEVVVEGIERAEDAALIASWGPVCGQGYLFSPAVPDADFRAYGEARPAMARTRPE